MRWRRVRWGRLRNTKLTFYEVPAREGMGATFRIGLPIANLT